MAKKHTKFCDMGHIYDASYKKCPLCDPDEVASSNMPTIRAASKSAFLDGITPAPMDAPPPEGDAGSRGAPAAPPAAGAKPPRSASSAAKERKPEKVPAAAAPGSAAPVVAPAPAGPAAKTTARTGRPVLASESLTDVTILMPRQEIGAEAPPEEAPPRAPVSERVSDVIETGGTELFVEDSPASLEAPGGRRFDLVSGINYLGQDPKNQVIVADRFVSSRHALVDCKYDLDTDTHRFILYDLYSRNGTFLLRAKEREKVEGKKYLQDGDIVQLGPMVRFVFRTPHPGSAPPAPVARPENS